MFPKEYLDCGRIEFTSTSVRVYKNYYDNNYLCNLPGGRIVNAYWQGTHIAVLMDSGKTYVYNDSADGVCIIKPRNYGKEIQRPQTW